MAKFILEGVVEPEVEDGGQALIAEIAGDEDNGLFVRIQSWFGIDGVEEFNDLSREEKSQRIQHPEMDQICGRKVRVTIETIDDA